MILKEFSQYLLKNIEESSIVLLNKWLKTKLENPAVSNVDKIIQTEIYIAKNKYNDHLFIGKSETGRKLMNALYNFSLSFEQQKISRWIHNQKPNDFKNC